MSELNLEEQKNKATKTLMTMLDYLGLDATVRIEEKGAKLAIKISSEDAGRIIGRKGQTLESLQLILNRIMFRGDESAPHVMLDIDGYSRNGGPRRNDGEESSEDAPRRGGNRRREGGRRNDDRNHGNEELLRSQALDAAKEVKRWGEPVMLPEMNAHDRRIIHVTLKEDAEVDTQSEGDGNLKKVVISLKKA